MNDFDEHSDELEKLIKKKTSEYQVSYNENDWTELEKKLDIRDMQHSYQKKLRAIAAAAVIIIALLGYFIFDNYNRITELSNQIAQQAEPGLPNEIQPFPQAIPGTQEHDSTEPGIPAADETETEADIPTTAGIPAETISASSQFSESSHITQKIAAASIADLKTVHSEAAYPPHPDLLFTKTTSPSEPITITGKEPSEAEISSLKQTGNTGLTAGLVISPDVSAAGSLSNFHDPGHRLGITLEYTRGDRFSISTGLIHSNVRYSSKNENYENPGYPGNGLIPGQMSAECQILDIPVSVKFDFLRTERSRFFITTGISSYIMLNEDYYFEHSINGETSSHQWNEQSGKMHWLSNAGFSAGYEYELLPSLGLRAEPFIKVPLKEVGWGNARLYSLGSFFSLNYRI